MKRRMFSAACLVMGCCLLVVPPATTFTIAPTRSAVNPKVPPVRATVAEKITPEAKELLDVFQARETNAEDQPHLIVAQVAPSVRYVHVLL